MALIDVVDAYFAAQRTLTLRAARSVARLWRLDPSDLDGSWGDLLPDLLRLLGVAQLSAAGTAEDYVDAALRNQDIAAEAIADVSPDSLAGRTADGRRNTALLLLPVINAKRQIASGGTAVDALARSRRDVARLVATEIADTGRSAVAVASAVRPDASGYARVVRADGCGRCQSAASTTYAWSEAFSRHPNCDCVRVPTAGRRGDQLTTSAPTVAPTGMTTTADLSRRSGGRRGPEQVIADAASRSEAIDQLRAAGYVR